MTAKPAFLPKSHTVEGVPNQGHLPQLLTATNMTYFH